MTLKLYLLPEVEVEFFPFQRGPGFLLSVVDNWFEFATNSWFHFIHDSCYGYRFVKMPFFGEKEWFTEDSPLKDRHPPREFNFPSIGLD